MSALDFQDREPALKQARRADNQVFAGNNALYERLQGQGRKGALERYGWIAVPVAAVAIIGVVAATSTPHESANDVVGAPGQTASAAATSVPSKPVTPPVNEALASNDATQTPEEAALSGKASATAASPSQAAKSQAAKSPAAAAPAPVKVARRAPAADTSTARPAAAAPAERAAPTPDTAAAPPVPAVQAPAPAAPATQDVAPQPAEPAAPAPSTDTSATQAAPSQGAPADTPAQ